MSIGPAFERAWRKRFEGFAERNDDEAGIAGWTNSGLQTRLRRFAALWRVPTPGQRWLDAGCGAGTYTRLLEEHGLEVVGVDYSLTSLRKARARDGSAHAHPSRY